MNLFAAVITFLLGGFSVIALEAYELGSIFDGIRDFLRMLVG